MSTNWNPAFAARRAATTNSSTSRSSSSSSRTCGGSAKRGSRIGCSYAVSGAGRSCASGFEKRPECVSCRPTTRSRSASDPNRCAVGGDELLPQSGQRALGAFGDQQLVRARASVVADGDRFATPDQLGAALAEMPPAPARQLARLAIRRAVPALHRQARRSDCRPKGLPARTAGPAATRQAARASHRRRAGSTGARGALETRRPS